MNADTQKHTFDKDYGNESNYDEDDDEDEDDDYGLVSVLLSSKPKSKNDRLTEGGYIFFADRSLLFSCFKWEGHVS